jgi:hypothetical protein
MKYDILEHYFQNRVFDSLIKNQVKSFFGIEKKEMPVLNLKMNNINNFD